MSGATPAFRHLDPRACPALAGLVLACLSVGALLVPVPAVEAKEPEGPKTAETFAAALESVQKSLRSGKCARGLRVLREQIRYHGEQPYIAGRRTELVDLTRRLAFGARFPPPDPDDLASGDIRSYNPRTGRIIVRYRPDQMADWSRERGFSFFPASASGRLTFTIKGKRYPELANQSFVFLFGNQEHPKTGKKQLYEIYFGSPKRSDATHEYWLNPKLIHHDGDSKRESAALGYCPITSRGTFHLEVKITPTRITAKANRKKIAEIRKDKEVWGILAFRGSNFDEIKLDGEIEPSWMQGKLDEVAQGHREAFEKDFDPAAYLPAWLLKAKGAGASGSRMPLPAHPKGLSKAQAALFRLSLGLDVLGAGGSAGKKFDQLVAGGLPKGAAHYLTARTLLVQHELVRARTAITQARAFTQDFARAALLEGFILTLADRAAEADALMAPVVAKYAPDEALYSGIAIGLMRSGRADAARRISALAARHGVTSPNLELLEQALLKAVKGPDWRRVYEVKTKTYHVVTDIDKKTARAAATVLEQMHRTYQSTLQKIPADSSRLFKVYLFSGQAGFLGYLGDLRMFWGAGGKQAAGVYSPLLKQLLIWNLPSRDEMLATVRHEGFHQFFDRYLPHAPVWFNEGLAEYYEASDRYAGSVRAGLVAYENVRFLKKHGLIPVEKLFRLTGRSFYQAAPGSYAMSWLVVHRMRKGSEAAKGRYRRFMAALEAGDAASAMKAAFPEKDLPALDRALAQYLASLPDGR